ncbi:hypothetical protein HI914_07121 [Erysiphe necator]|nr:hypothetical protein HI914_07121 [Erysiphe necator]
MHLKVKNEAINVLFCGVFSAIQSNFTTSQPGYVQYSKVLSISHFFFCLNFLVSPVIGYSSKLIITG